MSVVVTEIRRSPGLVAFPLLAAAEAVVVLRDAGFSNGDWQATSIQVQFGSILLGPLVAAVAAYAAGRGKRYSHESLAATTPRPQLAAVALQWGAVTLWGLLAYGVGLAAAFGTTSAAVAGGPWPSYLILGALAVCVFSAVGYALGKLLTWRIAAPFVGILAYACLIIMGLQSGWVGRLDMLHGAIPASPEYHIRGAVLAIEVLWALSVVGLALVAAGTGRLSVGTRAPLLGVAAVPAAGAVLLAALLGGGDLARRSAPDQMVCQGSAPRVCVWPEHAKWAAAAAGVARRLDNALGDVAPLPSTVYEEGLPKAPPSGGPVIRVDTIPMTPPSFVGGLAAGMLPAFPPDCATGAVRRIESYVLIKVWMQTRAAGGPGPDVLVDEDRLQKLLDRSPSGQRTWVHENLPSVASCSAPLPPLASSGP